MSDTHLLSLYMLVRGRRRNSSPNFFWQCFTSNWKKTEGEEGEGETLPVNEDFQTLTQCWSVSVRNMFNTTSLTAAQGCWSWMSKLINFYSVDWSSSETLNIKENSVQVKVLHWKWLIIINGKMYLKYQSKRTVTDSWYYHDIVRFLILKRQWAAFSSCSCSSLNYFIYRYRTAALIPSWDSTVSYFYSAALNTVHPSMLSIDLGAKINDQITQILGR